LKEEPLRLAEEEEVVEGKSSANSKERPPPLKYPFRTELSSKIMSSSGKSLKKPWNVVRPAPLDGGDEDSSSPSTPISNNKRRLLLGKEPGVWLPIFRHLPLPALAAVLRVSRDWNKIGMSPSLWETIDLSHK
jgi:hypothetical protein